MSELEAWRDYTVEQALKLMPTVGKLSLQDLRIMKGSFEILAMNLVPPEALGKLRTLQNHTIPDENRIAVRTEYWQATPLEEEGITPPQSASYLTFGVGVTYNFAECGVSDLTTRIVYAKIQAISHTWAFWREFAYSAYSRMMIAANIVPLLQGHQAASMAGFKGGPAELLPPSGSAKTEAT